MERTGNKKQIGEGYPSLAELNVKYHFVLFLDSGRFKLAYQISNSDKNKTIVFIHGNSASSRTWQHQLNSLLLRDYRLIAFDLPAHGKSSDSDNPLGDYSLKGLGRIMAQAVKDLLQDDTFVIAGVSVGTNIVAEMLTCGLAPRGMVMAGSCMLGVNYTLEKIFFPDADIGFLLEDSPEREKVSRGYACLLPDTGPEYLLQVIDDFYAVRPPFRSCLSRSLGAKEYSDELNAVKQTGIPVLTIFGKHEKAVNPDYLDDAPFRLWREKSFKCPGGHFIHADSPEMFNTYLAAYAAEAFGGWAGDS